MTRFCAALAILSGTVLLSAPSSRADIPPGPSRGPVAPPKPAPTPPPPPPVAPTPAPVIAKSDPAVPVIPDPSKAGEAKAVTFDFEGLVKEATLPPGFIALDGRWLVGPDKETKSTAAVLRQDLKVPEYAIVLATGEGRSFGDATATVRFRPESGDEDASGGVVFRATDAKNYGLVRANANEGNFRIYTVHNGFRRQIASVDIEAPKLMEWHTIALSFVGSEFEATLDGKDRITATNDTLPAGWCGLWTKADSVTSFDDLKIEPAARKTPNEKPATPVTK